MSTKIWEVLKTKKACYYIHLPDEIGTFILKEPPDYTDKFGRLPKTENPALP